MNEFLRIGELGQATGVDVETIRYYEKIGLLPKPARRDNGYRSYGAAHVERLAFIRHARALDIPLADIQRLLDFVAHPERDCGDIDRLIDAQLERCGERHAAGECGILHELVAAAHGEACACHAASSPAAG